MMKRFAAALLGLLLLAASSLAEGSWIPAKDARPGGESDFIAKGQRVGEFRDVNCRAARENYVRQNCQPVAARLECAEDGHRRNRRVRRLADSIPFGCPDKVLYSQRHSKINASAGSYIQCQIAAGVRMILVRQRLEVSACHINSALARECHVVQPELAPGSHIDRQSVPVHIDSNGVVSLPLEAEVLA